MSRKNSTAVGIGAAISGAAIAAFIGMGTAHATPNGSEADPWQNTDTGGFSELFGGTGSVQGADDLSADTSLADSSSGNAAALSTDVATFEDGADHPITDLVYALDPSAFQFQDSPDISAVGEGFGGSYLVPDDFLGYLATSLDYFTLNPTGLDYALGPLIDILLGGSFT
jgi:hypothetical protein